MEYLEQLLAVDVIEAEPLAMVPPTGGLSGAKPWSADHVFGSGRDRPKYPQVFLQTGILVGFSRPDENAREISDKGHHAKAAYHRPIGIEGQVSGEHQEGPHRRPLQHHG